MPARKQEESAECECECGRRIRSVGSPCETKQCVSPCGPAQRTVRRERSGIRVFQLLRAVDRESVESAALLTAAVVPTGSGGSSGGDACDIRSDEVGLRELRKREACRVERDLLQVPTRERAAGVCAAVLRESRPPEHKRGGGCERRADSVASSKLVP